MRKDLSDATEVVKTRKSNRENLRLKRKGRIKNETKTANSGRRINSKIRNLNGK